MAREWYTENRIHLGVVGAMLMGLLAMWILYGWVGHSLIRALYEATPGHFGYGWIQERHMHPLEVYLALGDHILQEITLLTLGGIFISFLIPYQRGEVGNFRWKVLCVSLIFGNLLLMAVPRAVMGPVHDFQNVCAAVDVWLRGKDPYLVANTIEYCGFPYPFVYPPFSLYWIQGLCYGNRWLGFQANYFLLFSIVFLGIFFVIRRGDDHFHPWLFITLLLTGFFSAHYGVLFGNMIWVELFFLAMAFYWILKEKYSLAGVFLAFGSVLRIFPILFGLPFILAPQARGRRWKNLWIMGSLFGGILVCSFLQSPAMTVSAFRAILGKIPGQVSPALEGGGAMTPTPYFLIKDLMVPIGGEDGLVFLLYGLFALLTVGIFAQFVKRRNRSFLEIFSAGVLVVLILFPRVKPYYFIWASLPVYFLVRTWNRKDIQWAVLIVSGLPLILYGLSWGMVSDFYLGRFFRYLELPIEYGQGMALFFFFLFFMARDARQSPSSPQPNQ